MLSHTYYKWPPIIFKYVFSLKHFKSILIADIYLINSFLASMLIKPLLTYATYILFNFASFATSIPYSNQMVGSLYVNAISRQLCYLHFSIIISG